MFKAKRLFEKVGTGTSIMCPDHLSRQFLITAFIFLYSSKNSSAEHTHAFYTCPCARECVCVCERERERECVCERERE